MRFFVSNFKWVMLISGLLTCTMFLGLISPQASLKSNFGVILEGSAVEIIVRNWADSSPGFYEKSIVSYDKILHVSEIW